MTGKTNTETAADAAGDGTGTAVPSSPAPAVATFSQGDQMTKTTMGAALEAKGVKRRDNDLLLAIAKFQNVGGTYDEARRLLDEAYSRQRAQKEGQTESLAAPEAGSGGRMRIAREGHGAVAAAPTPPRPPRGLQSIAAAQPTVAKSLFDLVKLPDGRPLRSVRWSECPDLARRYNKVAHILTMVHRWAVPPDPATTIDAVVTEEALAKIVADAEAINGIA